VLEKGMSTKVEREKSHMVPFNGDPNLLVIENLRRPTEQEIKDCGESLEKYIKTSESPKKPE
jgi:hypothetical protein